MPLRSIHHMLFMLPLSPQGEDSSHFPAPTWDPSHGRHSSINFSSVSASHILQFFTNCFHGTHPSQKQSALVQASFRVMGFFGCSHLLWHGLLLELRVDSPLTSVDCRETACHLTTDCRGISAPVHHTSPFSFNILCPHSCFFHMPLSPPAYPAGFALLNMVLWRHYHCC